jgi:hypothetical protein
MATAAQEAAERQAAAMAGQAKDLTSKVSETVQNAVGNLMPGDQR